MTQHSNPESLIINLSVHVSLEEHLIVRLRQLVSELIAAAGLVGTSMVMDVYFAPHHLIGPGVNRLVGSNVFPPGTYVPSALIVPKGDHSGLTCTVFLDGQMLVSLSTTSCPDDLVLSLLEELLHARVYHQRWEQEGSVGGVAGKGQLIEEVLASRVHDEYMVCRIKGDVVGNQPLFDTPGMPGYKSTRILQYGDNVGALLANTYEELRHMQKENAQDWLTQSELQNRVANLVFRGCLDPLVRSHAFYDGMPEDERSRYELEDLTAPLFVEHVSPYWQRIYSLLRESFADELQYMSPMIRAISVEIRLLLADFESLVRYPESD